MESAIYRDSNKTINMKVLFLSYDGMTDPLGQSQVIPYLSGLVKKGYDISIISFEKEERNAEIAIIQSLLHNNHITWIPLKYTKKPPVLSTLYDIYCLNKTVKSILKKNSEENFILHCRSYITSLIGLKFSRRQHRVKFIFDMRGFWADERIDGNIWNLSNPVFKRVYNYFKRRELEFFEESDYTISLTYAGKKEISKITAKNNTESSPIQVIPCCVDNELFDKAKIHTDNIATLKQSLNISKKQFVLGYVGSIGTWYMLHEMILFFKKLIDHKPNSVFLFVTKEDPDYIFDQFQSNGIDRNNIRIVASGRENMPSYISLFNWSIFFIKPIFSKQASSPTKQGEIMSMGKPIICNSGVGDTEEIINKYSAGIVIDKFDETTFAQSINEMEKFQVNSEKIRKGAIDFFSLETGINNYAKVYQACS